MAMMDIIHLNEKQKRSKDSTFFYVGTLPKISLPNLQESVDTFIRWCSPLLNQEELKETIKACNEFIQGGGEELQKELQKYDTKSDTYSWLDNFWPTRYLGRRSPVAINANFFFAFNEQEISQTLRASNLICAGVYYKQQLDEEKIPADKIKETPLCMVQNKYLFSTTRIPGKNIDSVNTPYSKQNPGPSKARHIIVIHNHQIFSLEVINKQNQAYNTKQIEQALKSLMLQSSDELEAKKRVGYITSLERTIYSDIRDELLSKKDNLKQMKIIEDALFCVCLDSEEPDDLSETSKNLLHGDGGNRWFDKSISLVVFKNAMAGINIEHCGLDGTTAISFVDFIHNQNTLDVLENNSGTKDDNPIIEKVNFHLDTSLEKSILQAKTNFTTLAQNTATKLISFDEFGSSHIKSLGISPDAFLQIAFQIAHYKTKGFIGATYESIATRQFERGRTEAMRVVTPAIVDLIEVINNENSSKDNKKKALLQAANEHVNRIRECQNSKAPEQHLWQLQLIAQEKGKTLRVKEDFSLFHCAGWLKMRNDYLSTSSAPSKNVSVFGFGATSNQCIGTAYIARSDSITIHLSTPREVAKHMENFADNLGIAFREMSFLLKNS